MHHAHEPDDGNVGLLGVLMALQKTLIDVPLALGLDQKTSVRHLEVGKAATIINGRQLKNHTVRKRFGQTALSKSSSDGPAIASALAGGSLRGMPLLLGAGSGGGIYSYSDASAEWNFVSPGSDHGMADQVPVEAENSGTTYDVGVCQGNGFTVVAYVQDSSGPGTPALYSCILDANTGAVVVSPTLLASTALGLRLFVLGTTAILVYVSSATTLAYTISAQTLSLSAPLSGWSGATALATTTTANGGLAPFDAQPVTGDPTRFLVGFVALMGNGNKTCQVNSYNASLTQLATLVTTGGGINGVVVRSISVWGQNGGQFLAAWNGSTGGTRAWTCPDGGSPINPTGSSISSLTNCARMVIAGYANGNVVVGMSSPATANASSPVLASTATQFRQLSLSVTTVTTVGTEVFLGGVVLGSTIAVASATLAYCMVYLPSTYQGTQYMIALDWWGTTPSSAFGHRVTATMAPRLWKSQPSFGYPTWNGGTYPTAYSVSPQILWQSGTKLLPAIFQSTATAHTALLLQPLDSAATSRHFCAELGNQLLMSGGCPQLFDGQNASELYFAYYPECAAPSLAGGGLTGGYSWIFVFEYYDNEGNVLWSQTSPAVTATLSAQEATFTIPTLSLGLRGGSWVSGVPMSGQLSIVPYRTTAGGTTYYRVISDPAPSANLNSYSSASISWTDNTSDASIASNQLLYTTGGVLDNVFPEGKSIAIQHLGRWWLAGGGNPTALWPSQAVNPGTTPGFNESLNFYATGPIRALASLDASLVLFVQRGSAYGIEVIQGQGPTNLGTQSDWTPPQPVPSGGAGAKDQRSVAVTPDGVFFLSPTGGPNGQGGIFKLTRDFQVQYIGAPVEDLVAQYPICTSAAVHPNGGYVYFTMVSSDVAITTGVRLVWDFLQGIWSVDQVYDSDQALASCGARWGFVANTASAGEAYHWVTAAGRVYRETNGTGANSYFDSATSTAATWVTLKYQSAPLKPSLSGFARFWRLQSSVDMLDPHDLTMQLTYDYAPSSFYAETQTFTAATFAAQSRYPQEDVEMMPGAQKGRAIQVTLTDAYPTGVAPTTGQGPQFGGFTLELGVEQGARFPNVPTALRG